MSKVYIKEINAYFESYLSMNHSPIGEFTNLKGEIIAFSSYDKISKITGNASLSQIAYFKGFLDG